MNVGFSHPQQLPFELDYGYFARELADAQYSLGLLQGSQRKLINPDLLISPLTAKEAAISSKIEGTQSTETDVFLYEAGGEARFQDTAEVVNYRKAMTFAIAELKDGKRCTTHFIKTIHSILLNGVRHRGKIGDFREGPVWIAKKYGDPIEKATYVPPEQLYVPEYMDNLISYINASDDKVLITAGITHYQFEAIHPFDDGNGRIGRLMIPFLLHLKKQLSSPLIYLSGYFESHRDEYIAALHEVDITNKKEPWLRFFLTAVTQQSHETQILIDKIYDLYDLLRVHAYGTKSPNFHRMLDFIFKQPVFTVRQLCDSVGVSYITAVRFVKLFQKEKIFNDIQASEGKTSFYIFVPLIDILE